MNLGMQIWFGGGMIVLSSALYLYSLYFGDKIMVKNSKDFFFISVIAGVSASIWMWVLEQIYTMNPQIPSPFPGEEGFLYGGVLVTGALFGCIIISINHAFDQQDQRKPMEEIDYHTFQ